MQSLMLFGCLQPQLQQELRINIFGETACFRGRHDSAVFIRKLSQRPFLPANKRYGVDPESELLDEPVLAPPAEADPRRGAGMVDMYISLIA